MCPCEVGQWAVRGNTPVCTTQVPHSGLPTREAISSCLQATGWVPRGSGRTELSFPLRAWTRPAPTSSLEHAHPKDEP